MDGRRLIEVARDMKFLADAFSGLATDGLCTLPVRRAACVVDMLWNESGN